MKADGVAKLYDALTLDERVRLRLHAFARRDRADWERLDRTCPPVQRGAYCERLDASDVLTLCCLVDLLPTLAKLQMVGAMRPLVEFVEGAARDAAWLAYLDGYHAGWRAAGTRGEPPDVADDELAAVAERRGAVGDHVTKALDTLASAFAARARTPRDGLAAFARDELGVPLDVLLGAWGATAIGRLAQHAEALDAAEPAAEELALMGDVLRLAWRRHGLNDPTAEVPDELRERFEAMVRGDA